MNERTKQLWEQAAKTTQGDSWEEQTKFIEKFAELIVQECAEVIFKTPVEYIEIDAMHRIRDNVKSHFGVE